MEKKAKAEAKRLRRIKRKQEANNPPVVEQELPADDSETADEPDV